MNRTVPFGGAARAYVACLFVAASLAPPASFAQPQPASVPVNVPVMEAYPQHIRVRLERQRAEAAPTSVRTAAFRGRGAKEIPILPKGLVFLTC